MWGSLLVFGGVISYRPVTYERKDSYGSKRYYEYV